MPRRRNNPRIQSGRKRRPWNGSILPSVRTSVNYYQRHLALEAALAPIVLKHLKEKFDVYKGIDKDYKYEPVSAERGDVILYCMELTLRRHGIDPDKVENAYVNERQKEDLLDLILGRGI